MIIQGLTLAKTLGFIGYSLALWAAGVIVIRYGGAFCGRTNLRKSITMAVTIPVVYFFIRITDVLFGLNGQNRLAAFALGDGVASVLDGITHTWFPDAYEDPLLQNTNPLAARTFSRYGSGWLLYFVGLSLVMVVLM